jgi:potassium-transporting ATPase ATP-binding subunit
MTSPALSPSREDAVTPRPPKVRFRGAAALFEPAILRRAAVGAVRKLDPRMMIHIPVMFVVEIGSVITTVEFIVRPNLFTGLVTLWLWATVLFANFAEAVAEGRGKAQADTLRKARKEAVAHRLTVGGATETVPSTELKAGDRCVVGPNQVIPGDGDVIEGIAVVDESAITGESAPVIRESGGDRSAVTGGTVVLSDQITVEITSNPGHTFLDRMIALVEGASRQKTPNEVALDILIAGMTLILLVAVVTLQPMAVYDKAIQSTVVLIALFVCLAPTTIGGLLSAIGIAGMDRMVQRNVLAMSGRAVEAAGDCSTLLLDKTGTITYGNRMAAEFIPARGVTDHEFAEAALLSSMADETPEGRSIVDFAQERLPVDTFDFARAELVPFTAQTRMSGIDLPPDGDGHPGRRIRKGAADSVRAWVLGNGGTLPDDLAPAVEQIAVSGGTPLVVADGPRVLGVIYLKDTVKQGMPQRFAQLRDMGIRTVMITGDNPLTAKAIAAEAGVDDFLAEATPEAKLALIRREQRGGHMVAMTGDGTNDAPALAQADVGLAMNTGTQAAKEAGNMVDLDSNPTKLIEVVEVAKQLLITRGSLTTFSIANDVAKYFAIIPAMFVVAYPKLRVLNVMHLDNPHTAILSAVIYNAVIIPALIPLALRGVKFKPLDGAAILRRNTLIYGIGGIVAPFAFIKLIDLLLTATGLH